MMPVQKGIEWLEGELTNDSSPSSTAALHPIPTYQTRPLPKNKTGNSPISPSPTLSIQTLQTVESAFHPSSLTLYPLSLPLPPCSPPTPTPLKTNSPLRSPFRSKNTTSCLPSGPLPSPPFAFDFVRLALPNRCVAATMLPAGLHASVCSRPGTSSDVLECEPVRVYVRRTRCAGRVSVYPNARTK